MPGYRDVSISKPSKTSGHSGFKMLPVQHIEKTGRRLSAVKINKTYCAQPSPLKQEETKNLLTSCSQLMPSVIQVPDDNPQMKNLRASTPIKTRLYHRRLSEIFQEFTLLSPITTIDVPSTVKNAEVPKRCTSSTSSGHDFPPTVPVPSSVLMIENTVTKKKDGGAPTKKLGRPLLSSTKIHESMNDDRLLNAVRLYQHRLKVKLNKKDADLVTSQLLHKNAMVDTIFN